MTTPIFIITIDTEGDALWSKPRTITTRNAKFLPRFQSLCEAHDLKPTYLTNYEMATCPAFQDFGRDLVKRKTGEIGMHLHAWDSPPLIPLTSDDGKYHPYLIEYSEHVMREKISYITGVLEQTFGVKITSHRAGRWSFDSVYARSLVEKGYLVDCSVTPHVSWKRTLGDPNQTGGTDYTSFPEIPYWLDLEDIRRPGHSPLLEVPMTIQPNHALQAIRGFFKEGTLPRRALNHLAPSVFWLRPNGRNLKSMLRILNRAIDEQRPCVEFMLHSSELMPAGSPIFPTEEHIESLYQDLETLFRKASGTYRGATMTEFYREFSG